MNYLSKIRKALYSASLVLAFMVSSAPAAEGESAVGMITALKGNAIIQRGSEMLSASVKDSIMLDDTITALAFSRIKIHFNDDSVVTLYSNSKMNIKEYLDGEEGQRGKSIIKLIDGKLKSLVGKHEFEVHTPSAVAAARGTYFFVIYDADTWVFVFEGIVGFRALLDPVQEEVRVEKGEHSKVTAENGETSNATEPEPSTQKMLKEKVLECESVNEQNR